jgi:hypothetical protein
MRECVYALTVWIVNTVEIVWFVRTLRTLKLSSKVKVKACMRKCVDALMCKNVNIVLNVWIVKFVRA